MRLILSLVIFFTCNFTIGQFTLTNPYIYPGVNIKNTLFIGYPISPSKIIASKVKSITEETNYGKEIFYFNKNGKHFKIESYGKEKGKFKILGETLIEYDSNNHMKSIINTYKDFKIEHRTFFNFNKNGHILSYKDYTYTKNKITDSSIISIDSVSKPHYYISYKDPDYKYSYKLNFENKILSGKSTWSIDSIAIRQVEDSTIKTYWYKNDYTKSYTIGKIDSYYNNLLIDEKTFDYRGKGRQVNHKTYKYDELNRLTMITLDKYIKDKVLYLYHLKGFLYQKVERVSEMEFIVTKYSYTFW